jgi:hypothetical protein
MLREGDVVMRKFVLTGIIVLLILLSGCFSPAQEDDEREHSEALSQEDVLTSEEETDNAEVTTQAVETSFVDAFGYIYSLEHLTPEEMRMINEAHRKVDPTVEDIFAENLHYYLGNYHGCYVRFEPGFIDWWGPDEIGGSWFSQNHKYYAYYAGECYSLREAYENGYLTEEDLVIISELAKESFVWTIQLKNSQSSQ